VAASSANLAFARVDEGFGDLGEKVIDKQYNLELTKSRAARLGTSTSPQNTDTLWLGYTPGFAGPNNYWSIYSGFGKDGYRRPVNGQPDKGNWTFDTPVQGDSLQGWTPIRTRYYGGAGTFNDRARPFQGIDYGNNSNYRSSTGTRTFGVTGVWHVDGGNTVAAPAGRFEPNWAPSVGAGAAWMGVRAHGDLSYQDPVTGNYFNEDIMQYNIVLPVDADGNDKGMPGYGAQMDQMLYRDIDFTGKTNQNLTVTFRYRTVMSQGANTAAGTTAGWFNHDPLGNTAGVANPQLNNYISAEDGGTTNAPRDSFMVYIGSGVDGNQWLGSDGNLRNVYDPQRRWFAEVLHADLSTSPPGSPLNPQPTLYKELLSVAGNNPVDAAVNPFSYVITGFTIPNAALAPFLAKNNKIRLVFRVKTNRGTSDETTDYSSNRAGAAVVDAVTYKIGANPTINFGDFDSPNEIDNAIGVSATDKWKSTGKPPQVQMHAHLFSSLPYNDVCGDKGDPGRLCDMTGGVLSVGNHDDSEAANGIQGTAEADRTETTFSPSIQFVGPYNQGVGGDKNAQGIRGPGAGAGDVEAGEDYYVYYEYNAGLFLGTNGSFWTYAVKSYPGRSKTTHGPGGVGYQAWGSIQVPTFIISSSGECLTDLEPVKPIMLTSNASGIADSIQIGLTHFSRCFRLGLAVCGDDGLGYFDNVSLAIIDGAPIQTTFLPWDFYNDAFPANESAGYPGDKALFDTTAAWFGTGLNTAQIVGSKNRYNIPGDTMFIQATPATGRVDMVFRVLPGPGNYHPIGAGHAGNLRRVPSNSATVTPGDGSWWDAYRTNSGAFSSNPNGPMLNLKAGWNPDFWLSARCDTAELNLYAFQGRSVLGGPPDATDYCSAYHESDPKYNILGIVHNKCFVRCSAASVNDIICDGTVPTVPGTPACRGYLPLGTLGTTREGTKIIPDGLLTPGAHVEYFFREQKDTDTPLAEFAMSPDTSKVFPQLSESSTDAHRWQELSVLPDRWKDPQYTHPTYQLPGRGNACLLVVDMNDRRGNERVWVSVADTIGSIDPIARGAHNGWAAPGGADLNLSSNFIAKHGGQAGSRGSWDFFQAKASESGTTGGRFGDRLGYRGGDPFIAAKAARGGPTPEMLDVYYTLLLILNGDLDRSFFGPFKDRATDETALVQGWLNNGDTGTQNRGIWVMGDGFVEALTVQINGNGTQQALLASHFGVGLEDASYRDFTANVETPVDLRVHPEFQGKEGGIQYFGVRNVCIWYNDVLKLDGVGLNLGSVASEYDGKASPGGVNRQIAGVFKDFSASSPVSPWKSLVDGWDIEHLTTRNDPSTIGRSGYFMKIFTNVWAKIWPVAGTPVVPLDVPSFDDGGIANFVNLANNPLRTGSAELRLGLQSADRVQVRVYDVAGREVRMLADHWFEAGPHKLFWDGRDNGGRQVARGVYFAQVRYLNAKIAMAKQLVVLK
jgi:hypothetical protein